MERRVVESAYTGARVAVTVTDVTLCKNANSSGSQPKSSARSYFGILVNC